MECPFELVPGLRLEQEDLDARVRVVVVGAEERDHAAARQALDGGAHLPLEDRLHRAPALLDDVGAPGLVERLLRVREAALEHGDDHSSCSIVFACVGPFPQ